MFYAAGSLGEGGVEQHVTNGSLMTLIFFNSTNVNKIAMYLIGGLCCLTQAATCQHLVNGAPAGTS